MRVSLRATSVALVLLAPLGGRASAQTGQKFAFIRSSALLEQAPGRVEAEAQFDRETGTYRSEIERMNDSLKTLVAAFEKAAPGLTPAARTARTTDLQKRQAEYQRRTQSLEQRAQQRQAELVQPIYDRVKLAIEDVRVEGGYSFIFNNDQGSPIMAADKNLDVTDRVIAKLRASVPVAPAAVRPAVTPPAAGAPAPAPAGVTRPVTPPQD
jgi:outer membrane protein